MRVSLPLLLAFAALPAVAGDGGAAAPLAKDAIGRPYYDCVHAAAFASKESAEAAVAKAHDACQSEAAGMQVKLMIEFQGVFDMLGPGLAEPQKARLRENVERMVEEIDGRVFDELAGPAASEKEA